MPASGGQWTDEDLEEVIGNLLRWGVIVAAVLVLIGGALYLLRHGALPPNYEVFHGEPADLRSVGGIVSGALSLSGRGIIQLGLLLLIATPVARVAFSAFGFQRERDYTYTAITLFVLALLLYSLCGGRL